MAEGFHSLLAQARAGSSEALGRLLDEWRPFLLSVADQEIAEHLRPKEGASDLVQETFLEAQREFLAFRGQSEAEWRGWLRRMLLHNVVDFARRFQDAAKRQVAQETPLAGCGSTPDGAIDVAADTPSPSSAVVHKEEEEVLMRAVERLPADYRDVVLWHHRDRLTYEEIAARMDRSAEAVRKLWGRAIDMLSQELNISD